MGTNNMIATDRGATFSITPQPVETQERAVISKTMLNETFYVLEKYDLYNVQ